MKRKKCIGVDFDGVLHTTVTWHKRARKYEATKSGRMDTYDKVALNTRFIKKLVRLKRKGHRIHVVTKNKLKRLDRYFAREDVKRLFGEYAKNKSKKDGFKALSSGGMSKKERRFNFSKESQWVSHFFGQVRQPIYQKTKFYVVKELRIEEFYDDSPKVLDSLVHDSSHEPSCLRKIYQVFPKNRGTWKLYESVGKKQ